MAGLFGFATPQDLLGKLGRELERLKASPNDQDVAFNFFITAEHMLDWIHPGRGNTDIRTARRNAEPLLQVVSHLANISKHFDNLDKRHDSVDSSREAGEYFGASYFGGSFFGGGFFGGTSLIRFKGGAVKHFGDSLPVLEVAERVHEFWRKNC